VGGLDNTVDTNVLHNAFVPFGEIVDISLPKPELKSSVDPHRGFGYIEFELAEDAREAIDNMDQSELFGRVIKVAAAKPQKDTSEGLGSKTALWQQVRTSRLFSRRCMLTFHRKAIWLAMLSMRKIAYQQRVTKQVHHMTQCKVLRAWTLQDPKQPENAYRTEQDLAQRGVQPAWSSSAQPQTH